MVAVAQLVRAPLCGSGGCRFKSGQLPQTQPLLSEYLKYMSNKILSSTFQSKNQTT